MYFGINQLSASFNFLFEKISNRRIQNKCKRCSIVSTAALNLHSNLDTATNVPAVNIERVAHMITSMGVINGEYSDHRQEFCEIFNFHSQAVFTKIKPQFMKNLDHRTNSIVYIYTHIFLQQVILHFNKIMIELNDKKGVNNTLSYNMFCFIVRSNFFFYLLT